ncbi:MAG TPA: cation:proton antiporter [Solirubrobacterales bacterium]|jgi:Kef-type K+ transport system membrane component KefB|nr:cation:proton antiporter [Solirubrobacterales bacterium]
MVDVDTGSFLVIGLTAALAATLVTFGGRWIFVPVVVLELLLGILIGPDILGLAQSDQFVTFFSNLGLGMLFFFAGYEIDFERIRGEPLKLALAGWVISLVLAYSLGGLLALAGIVLSLLFVGSAMATTAIGTLIPILDDAGELKTRFGTYLLAAGAVGEFGPILLITFLFSSDTPLTSGAVLMLFIVVAVFAAVFAVRFVGLGWEKIEGAMETSAQLPIRISVVLVFALAYLAADLGLDLLLGGFVAGIITRLALRGREVAIFESKLSAIGYGFLIPFFFVVSGVNFDMSALVDDPKRAVLVPVFFLLFLVVRGVPAMLLYRKILAFRDRAALAFFSATELPLVVAITTIAVSEGHMRVTTSAALVGAAVLSTAVYPLVGLRLRGSRDDPEGA